MFHQFSNMNQDVTHRKRDYLIYKSCVKTAYFNDNVSNRDTKITNDELSILLTLSNELELSQEEIKLINYIVIPPVKLQIEQVINDLKAVGLIFYSKKNRQVYVADEIVRVLRKIRKKQVADKFYRRFLKLLREPQINLVCRNHNIDIKLSIDEKIKNIINEGISFSKLLSNELHKEGTTLTEKKKFVNEIWISDKTRFGHHFTRSDSRLQKPTVNGQERSWQDALKAVADALKSADGDIAGIAGGMASNEDAWELAQLIQGAGGERLGAWSPTHTGADLVAQVGLPNDSNLRNLGKDDAVLIIASDLEEEVPIWRLRLKEAQDRGAYLVVANARMTKMEDFATDTWAEDNRDVEGVGIRYTAGDAVEIMENLGKNHKDIAKRLADAENLVIVAGAEGLSLDGHRALVQSAANFLIDTDHAGKENSGLLVPLPGANGMGLYYLGYTPETTQDIMVNAPKVLVTLDADILADDPFASEWLAKVETVISLTMFAQDSVSNAVIQLPIQSFAERDGTFTNGERRVQRFYTAQGPIGDALPAWKAIAAVRETLGQGRAKLSAAAVMLDITKNVDTFDGMRYKALGRTVRQYPDVGGDDKYYGGNAYQNKGGIGIQIPLSGSATKADVKAPTTPAAEGKEILIIPSTRLYNRDAKFAPTVLVQARVAAPYALISPDDAKTLGVDNGDSVEISFGDSSVVVRADVTNHVSSGAVVLPRQLTAETTPLVPTTGTVVKTSATVLQ